jgi:integrase
MAAKKKMHKVKFDLFGESFVRSFESKKKAEFFLRCINESNASIDPVTIDEGFKKYLDTEAVKKSQSSKSHDLKCLNELQNFFEVNDVTLLLEVKNYHLEEFQTELSMRLRGATVNRRFNTIKHCFKKLVHWGYLATSPCTQIRSLSERRDTKELWTPEQFKELRRAYRSSQDRLILDILWNTGARVSSVMKLKKEHFNEVGMYLIFSSQKGPYREAKNYISPIGPELSKKVKKHIKKIKSDYLFNLEDGRIYTPGNFCKKFQRIKKRTVLKNTRLGLHGIRHTFATRLHAQNIPIKTISKLLGHSTTKITEVYIHSTLDSLRKHLSLMKFDD